MDILYPRYEFMATGGAIGDALFFFCSGFTLFLGRMDRFDHWYKRRINRIYPTVFAIAFFRSLFFNNPASFTDVILYGGGWFVSCIMIYYIVIYLIRKFTPNHLWSIFFLMTLIVLGCYFFEDKTTLFMYRNTTFKYIYFFLFMLFGAIIGLKHTTFSFQNFKNDSLRLVLSIILFYGIQKTCDLYQDLIHYQIISLIPLFAVTFYMYRVCNSAPAIKLYSTSIGNRIIGVISALTLEIYLVQEDLFTDRWNAIFPLNLGLMFLIILITAYCIKVLSKIFAQTFQKGEYNWPAIFKLDITWLKNSATILSSTTVSKKA